MFSPKRSKTAISRTSRIFLKKEHLWTYVTVGSCSMLDFKDEEKISEFFTM